MKKLIFCMGFMNIFIVDACYDILKRLLHFIAQLTHMSKCFQRNKIYFLKQYILSIFLMDQEAARAAAKRLYQKVNFSGSPLQSYQIASLLSEAYNYLGIPFNPSSRDIKTYSEVLDANKDGQVTLADLQTMAVQFLCGPGVLTGHSLNSSYKKQMHEPSFISTNTYTSSNSEIAGKRSEYETKPAKNTQAFNLQEESNNGEYNQQTWQYLQITKKIFEAYADQHFTITSREVPQVLSETYETLGRKGYRPNQEDVRVWMKLCDGNGDGHVEYEQYEYFVVRSLERSGMAIYK